MTETNNTDIAEVQESDKTNNVDDIKDTSVMPDTTESTTEENAMQGEEEDTVQQQEETDKTMEETNEEDKQEKMEEDRSPSTIEFSP